MWPLVGSELGMPKKPNPKLSATTRTFAENLARLQGYYGLGLAEMARKCKTSDTQISRWLDCQTSPTLDSLHKVAARCGIEPYQLLIEGLEPKNLATVIAADTLARVSRARELLRDLDGGVDEEGDGEGPGHRPDPPRTGPSKTDSRRASHDRRRPQEKKPRP